MEDLLEDLWRIYARFIEKIYGGFRRIYDGFMEDLWTSFPNFDF